MTKSIEEQAEIAYPDIMGISQGSYRAAYVNGAKSRDAQWLKVVNELINYLMRIKDDPDFNFKGEAEMRVSTKKSYAINALIKANQMLKEMGVEND